MSQCPTGFEGDFLGCRAECPREFKFVEDGLFDKRCVLIENNKYSFPVERLPMYTTTTQDRYSQETDHVANEAARVRSEFAQDEEARKNREKLQREEELQGAQYSKLQTEFTAYKSVQDAANEVKEITKSLNATRPAVAPGDEADKEHRTIMGIVSQRLLLLQAVLALVVVSLIGYFVLPLNAAHSLTFLLACVGIAIGIFLKE
jgi:hypothetical protein